MNEKIIGQTFDQERALYNLKDTQVVDCIFAGPADGESALKESRDVALKNCRFSLRYPLWHSKKFLMEDSSMDELTRAAIWYASDGTIKNSILGGIKCLRECDRMKLDGCTIHSPEFGWKCRDLEIKNSQVESEYFLLECKDVQIDHLKMKGKYSFQYIENMKIDHSELDTKDAFWHSKNVTVENSVIKGEYLGWYSEGLTLIHCKIIGTQPLCCPLQICNRSLQADNTGTDRSFTGTFCSMSPCKRSECIRSLKLIFHTADEYTLRR